MSIRRGVLALLALCAIVVVVSCIGVLSDFFTNLLSNVDGILLLLASLLMAGIFTFMIYVLAKESGLWPIRRRKESAAKSPSQAVGPASEEKSGQEQTAGIAH